MYYILYVITREAGYSTAFLPLRSLRAQPTLPLFSPVALLGWLTQ